MPITEISIENFKGIGSRQTIPLRPITLLFGGNSAGKSTILQALHLFKEVLKTGSSDVDKLIPGTPGLDIGGFDQYVHNHDLDKKVSWKRHLLVSHMHGGMAPVTEHRKSCVAHYGERAKHHEEWNHYN